jgi:hypothetical protein
MDTRDKAIRLARDEVKNKIFAHSQQLLAVHDVATDEDGELQIAYIDEEKDTGSYRIYFPIRGEPYFFVVLVRRDEANELSVAWTYMEAKVRTYLLIGSKTLTSEEITSHVGIVPTKFGQMGDPISKKFPARRYGAHKWYFEPQAGIPGTVEHKLKVLLDAVRPAASRIVELKPNCMVRVVIVYEGWGGDWQFGGIYIDEDKVQTLAALGAEIDIDLYAFGPEMPDDDALDSCFGDG